MDLKSRKQLAAKITGAGATRIKINPEQQEEVSKAITREDIKHQIAIGAITIKPKKGISRGRLKIKLKQKKKGRRKGHGRRTGTRKARQPPKKNWITKIRAIRDELRKMKEAGEITDAEYRRYYRQAKGNMFNSRKHLRELIGRITKR